MSPRRTTTEHTEHTETGKDNWVTFIQLVVTTYEPCVIIAVIALALESHL